MKQRDQYLPALAADRSVLAFRICWTSYVEILGAAEKIVRATCSRNQDAVQGTRATILPSSFESALIELQLPRRTVRVNDSLHFDLFFIAPTRIIKQHLNSDNSRGWLN